MTTTPNDRIAARLRVTNVTPDDALVAEDFSGLGMTVGALLPFLPPPVTPNYPLSHHRLGRAQPPP